MTAASLPARGQMLRKTFSNLPIPGRYLGRALELLRVDLESIPVPILCRDRWDRFSVEIRSPKDIIERHILFQGYFEYRESRFVRETLKPGQTFLDVGANIGWHSLLAAERVGSEGRVLSFEPATKAYQQLLRNVAVNRFNCVETFHYGLSTADRRIEIFGCEDENSGANSLYGGGSVAPIEYVDVRRGDAVLAELNVRQVDLCKIDVEGAELDVIEGLAQTFGERRIHRLLVEVNSESLQRAGRSPDELIGVLRGLGFELREVRTGNSVAGADDLRHGINLIGDLRERR